MCARVAGRLRRLRTRGTPPSSATPSAQVFYLAVYLLERPPEDGFHRCPPVVGPTRLCPSPAGWTKIGASRFEPVLDDEEALAEDERRLGKPQTNGEWRAFVEGFGAESFRLKRWKIK